MSPETRQPWWLLGAMSGVLGLIVLDETIVTVSLPTISQDLGLSTTAAHWVVNAYLLSFTCSVAIGGRLGDHFSRRTYFALGAVLFALASALAAAAQDGGTLIAARALQGVAAAMIFPTSIALITAAFPPEKRGTAFGYQTTVGGLFMASGPLIGGLLTETVSWRMIFWIGVPFVIAIVTVLWLVWSPSYDSQKRDSEQPRPRLDMAGPIFLVVALFSLVTSVMQGPDWGWTAPLTLGVFVLGCVLLVVFRHREQTHAKPLLDLSLLQIPSFRGGVILFAIFQFEKITIFVFVAQYFQEVLGRSAVLSGLAVSLAIVPTLVTSILIGKATDRSGSQPVLVRGAAIHGAAILLLAMAAGLQVYWLALLPLVLWGASMPSFAIPVRRVQMEAVPMDKHAQATGINMTVQMLGGSLGLAICSALLLETQNYLLVFLLIGVTTLVAIPVAMRTLSADAASEQ